MTDAERAELDWRHHRDDCQWCDQQLGPPFIYCGPGQALRDRMVRLQAVQVHVPAWRRS